MGDNFKSFVILAGMRTGSNLLEATLNAIKGVTCFGEAFNPYMMGWPDKDELLGVTRESREADPHAFLARLQDRPGHLPGFRYFHDHDPRVFDAIIRDRTCAKIVLTRNPLDSHVSTVLARETNQWKLNETETPIPAAITYDGPEFRQMLSDHEEFHLRILQGLQASGQAAFWLGYDDLRDPAVMTGLLHWLGRADVETVNPANDQVPQNPRELAGKVRNFDQMQRDLQQIDPFQLHRIPSFEPKRGPAVPGFMASDRGLIFMPVRGGPTDQIEGWLQSMGAVQTDFTQSSLRQWKRDHPGHRSFTLLRHPLYRAWDAFLHLLAGARPELRQLMRDIHRVPLPDDAELGDLSDDQSARLFHDFLRFLRRNLSGQTTLPTHPGWASQTEVMAGFARFAVPDIIIREETMAADLASLAKAAGIKDAPDAPAPEAQPAFLHDPKLIAAAKAAYLRDYVNFGLTDPVA